MSTNVQFRVDDDTIAFLHGLGLKASELARAGLEKEVRRLRAEQWGRSLAGLDLPPLKPGQAAADVRAMRDAR